MCEKRIPIETLLVQLVFDPDRLHLLRLGDRLSHICEKSISILIVLRIQQQFPSFTRYKCQAKRVETRLKGLDTRAEKREPFTQFVSARLAIARLQFRDLQEE